VCIHTTYLVNFIETTDIVQRIQQLFTFWSKHAAVHWIFINQKKTPHSFSSTVQTFQLWMSADHLVFKQCSQCPPAAATRQMSVATWCDCLANEFLRKIIPCFQLKSLQLGNVGQLWCVISDKNTALHSIHNNPLAKQHPFNGPVSGWAGTRKAKPIWILLKQERQWVAVASAGSYTSPHLTPDR